MPAPARPLPLTEWLPVFEVLSISLPVTLPKPQAFLSFPFLFFGGLRNTQKLRDFVCSLLYTVKMHLVLLSATVGCFLFFLNRAITIPRDRVPQNLVALSFGRLRVIARITCTRIKQTRSPEITIPTAFLHNINRRSQDTSRHRFRRIFSSLLPGRQVFT